jgi:hypothetical protein
MATGAPNAILAINSLDRYINNTAYVGTQFLAHWAAGVNTLTLGKTGDPTVPFGTPVVGGILTHPGFPEEDDDTPRTVILSIVPSPPVFGSVITINTQTTGGTSAFGEYVDQLIPNTVQGNQPVSNTLSRGYETPVNEPYSRDFTIRSPAALIYGYIQRLVVSQIQLQYNIPTVLTNLNDLIVIGTGGNSGAGRQYYDITLPFGFYSPDELAAMIEIQINNAIAGINMAVTYNTQRGFIFQSGAAIPFFFASDRQLSIVGGYDTTRLFKTYRLLGITIGNSVSNVLQEPNEPPCFLYTPYIDIFSDVLTNYQTIKDANTQVNCFKGMVARVYLSGNGNVQPTFPTSALGTTPFVVTADMNSPKIIKWTPDVAVPSIDFQLRDCWGDLIPGGEYGYNTEFQMTLLCVEGREWNS